MIENNNLKVRIISSLFLVLFTLLLLLSNKSIFLVLSQLTLFMANWELLRLLDFKKQTQINKVKSNFLLSRFQLSRYDLILIFLINFFILSFFLSSKFFQLFFGVIIIIYISKFFKKDFIKIFSLLYVSIAFLCLTYLRLDENYLSYISFIILFAISVDVSAFFTGRTFGGPKLAINLSPGKTVSGAIGGILFPICLCMLIFFKNSGIFSICFMTLIFSMICQFGDLIESKLKRICSVKDSSNLIPGHGGVLDRLDSILALIIIVSILKLLNHDLFFIV